ncbi:MAG: hypothetical protein ACJ74Z_10690 [Bryobacteraceae bacterium]
MTHRYRSRVALGWLVALTLSTLFPVIASVLRLHPMPRWVGIADVCIAAALLVSAVWLSRFPGQDVSEEDKHYGYSCDHALLKAPLVLLAAFFLFRTRVDWTVLLCGLAWRAWLLSDIAPRLIASLRADLLRNDT